MRNILIICRKELRSYFSSPIAYLLLTMFALIFGFFFWNALGYFVLMGMESQMRGQMMPMNLNEMVIRPLLSNVGVVGLFFIPDDHHAPVRGRKAQRHHRTAGHFADTRYRNHHRKMAGSPEFVCLHAASCGGELCISFQVRQARLEAACNRLSRAACCRLEHCWRLAHLFQR